MNTLTFFVPGVCLTAGSKRAFVVGGKAVTVDDNKRVRDWRASVADAAYRAMSGATLMEGPLKLTAVFYLARPRGHFGSGRNATLVKDSAPYYPTSRGTKDTVKLTRAIEDAMIGIVYPEDSQNVTVIVGKRYADATHPPGARITVEQLPIVTMRDRLRLKGLTP